MHAKDQQTIARRGLSADYFRNFIISQGWSETGTLRLSKKELIEEVMKAKTCKVAETRVVMAILPFMIKNTHKYFTDNKPAVDIDDKITYAYLGVRKAIEKYDPEMLGETGESYSFMTYATPWIIQSLQRNVEGEGDLVRVPVHIHRIVSAVQAAYYDHCISEGMRVDEIKPFSKIDPVFAHSLLKGGIAVTASVESIIAAQTWYQNCLYHESISNPLGDGSDGDGDNALVGDTIDSTATVESEHSMLFDSPEDMAARISEGETLREAIKELPIRVRMIMFLRFGLGDCDELTLHDSGSILGLTRERIRQIEAKTLRVLRHWLSSGRNYKLANHSAFSNTRVKGIEVRALKEHLKRDEIESLLNETELGIFDECVASGNLDIILK